MGRVFGDDRLGVIRAVFGHVSERTVDSIDDAHVQDQIEVLGVPVLVTRALHTIEVGGRAIVGVDLHPSASILAPNFGKNVGATSASTRSVSMELHTPGRCTLAFTCDLKGHFRVGGTVDKDVTNTFVVLDDRNSCVLGYEPNQSFSASRYDHV